MKNSILLRLAVLMISCGRNNEKPTAYTMRQFMDITAINGGAFSPDEKKVLFNSRATGIFNAVEIDLETGEQTAVTASTTDAVFAQGYFPSDNRILYSSDKGGNEISHLYVRGTDGSVTDLITDSTAKAEFIDWSFSRNNLYYLSNSRNKQFFDLFKVSIDGQPKEGKLYSATAVYQNEDRKSTRLNSSH